MQKLWKCQFLQPDYVCGHPTDHRTTFVFMIAQAIFCEFTILIYIVDIIGENPKKIILAIIFDRINILNSSLLFCTTFCMLFQGTPHLTMVQAILW